MAPDENSFPRPPRHFFRDLKESRKYCQWKHPYTKWFRNVIRQTCVQRLVHMYQNRRELFSLLYQIPDQANIVCGSDNDHGTLFHNRATLYLTPLCLAIYMRNEVIVQLLLELQAHEALDRSYATEVFSQATQAGLSTDLMEIIPVCVAVRREYFEILPRLVEYSGDCDVTRPIHLRYCIDKVSRLKKIFRYQDVLDYAIESVLKKRGRFPLAKLVTSLSALSSYDTCSPPLQLESSKARGGNPIKTNESNKQLYKSLSAGSLASVEDKEDNMSNEVEVEEKMDQYKNMPCSTFRRLACIAFYEDTACRLSPSLMQAMNALLKNQLVAIRSCKFPSAQTRLEDLHYYFSNKDLSKHAKVLDQMLSLLLLCGIYGNIKRRFKQQLNNRHLETCGHLIYDTLVNYQWINTFLEHSPGSICEVFSSLPIADVVISVSLMDSICKHIGALAGQENYGESPNVSSPCATIVDERCPPFQSSPSSNSPLVTGSSRIRAAQSFSEVREHHLLYLSNNSTLTSSTTESRSSMRCSTKPNAPILLTKLTSYKHVKHQAMEPKGQQEHVRVSRQHAHPRQQEKTFFHGKESPSLWPMKVEASHKLKGEGAFRGASFSDTRNKTKLTSPSPTLQKLRNSNKTRRPSSVDALCHRNSPSLLQARNRSHHCSDSTSQDTLKSTRRTSSIDRPTQKSIYRPYHGPYNLSQQDSDNFGDKRVK